jgi:hypothetical protein
MFSKAIRVLALGGTSLVGALVACGGSPQLNVGDPSVTASASAALELYDGNGVRSGGCFGTLIGPATVLTSGHCVVGKSSWKVTMASGEVANATRAYTYDWKDFRSTKSHPLHHDLAIIKLDRNIVLASYPTVASAPLNDGDTTLRLRRASSGLEPMTMSTFDAKAKGFPHYYYAATEASEGVDAGAAVIDPKTNTIYGVVSGRGTKSGALYISRTDGVANWLGEKQSCNVSVTASGLTNPQSIDTTECHSGGSTPQGPSSDAGTTCTKDSGTGSGGGGGTTTGGGGTGTGSGGGTGTGSGGGPGTGSGGGSGSGGSTGADGGAGSGGGGGTCDKGGGDCHGTCPPSGGGGTGTGTGTNGGGGNGTPGTGSGGGTGTGTGTGTNGGGGNGTPGTGGGGYDGDGGYTGGGGYNGGDSPTCTTSDCGGCGTTPNCEDDGIDFGDCGCTVPPTVPPVKLY